MTRAAWTFLLPPSLGSSVAERKAISLGPTLKRRLDRDVNVVVADSYDEMLERLLAKRADLAWAPPAICAQLEDEARAIFQMVRARNAYCAAIVALRDSDLTFDTATGGRAAWVDPLSTAGCLLARAHLRSAAGRLPRHERYLGSYKDALFAVLDGHADLTSVYAALDEPAAAHQTLERYLGPIASKFRVLAFTPFAPTDGLVFAAHLDDGDVNVATESLKAVLSGETGSVILDIFEAERLQRAAPGAYAALRER